MLGLSVGHCVGPYELLAPLGAGGMGEVWKARDTRLGRLVALKVVRTDRAANPEHQRRLLQEARAASALHHPHIISVYDLLSEQGSAILVLEYVVGRTLDQLIPRKGMRLSEALRYAIAIADALAAAHNAGIVHRDLKPSNVMITEDGVVKLLDFGLAKLREPLLDPDTAETHVSVSEAQPHTQEGVVLGTISYMSPEQAEGRAVDARSDIFSFGCLLYEMITGQRPFQGVSNLATLSAIIRDEPKPPSSMRNDIPHDLQTIVLRCLRKDPKRRWQNMLDVKIALEELKEESDSGKLVAAPDAISAVHRTRWPWIAAGLLAFSVLAGLAIWTVSHGKRAVAALAAVPLTGNQGNERFPSFSPEGTRVAYAWEPPEMSSPNLYVKLLGPGDPVRLTTNPAGDSAPAWSPDGGSIAFLRARGFSHATIIVIPSLGGPERNLAEISFEADEMLRGGISHGSPPFLAWSADTRWLFALEQQAPGEAFSIIRISLDTGEKRPLTFPPKHTSGDSSLAVSPDGKTLAFTRSMGVYERDIYLVSLSPDMMPQGDPRRLTSDAKEIAGLAWTADGQRLVFASGRAGPLELWETRLSPGSEPVRLPVTDEEIRELAIARQGQHLVYSHPVVDRHIWRLALNGKGAEAPHLLISSARAEYQAKYSPDGQQIAFESKRSGNDEIWRCQADGSHPVQVTAFRNARAGSPRWSPDGQQIAFDSNAAGNWDIYVVRSQGGRPTRLTTSEANEFRPSWSHDGKWIYYCSTRTGRRQIWKMSAAGGNEVQVTQNGGYVAFESVDGQTLFYTKEQGLWKKPLQGGNETRVASLNGTNFAPAKRGVYFLDNAGSAETKVRVQFLDYATQAIRTLAVVSGRVGTEMSVSPDERWMLFPKSDREGSELMLVDNMP